MLHDQIKEEIKTALKARAEVRLQTLRNLVSAFVTEVTSKNRKPDEKLTDEEALVVIKRLVKQRQDSIEQFTAGGRADLAQAEEAEMAILKTYLPAEMPTDQIKAIALAKKTKLGINDRAKIGILVGAVMKETKGQTDGKIVKEIVESLF
ncbi:MAG: glutamyl-tRNA amidotransferase [Candidatus Vogelbacteria bacterium CG22_combo_CG10-13_8_21_14_all_37_9]|uniref:Glutamyl-tRNA amidotransferase n=1 Tax=Candidatus Vogelbacteria bacterium CG22_combo_CG10-13_8_21_14_all_37_9 TaxID=1975046 RepID=A0A2H0BKG0_9BACT|nr:MAG: glutamyl-tRNA amidotransferase [Candidatus Vogelbacteria bacterium CG22_combo_CG10-13_8_21_14_all_37_9]